MSRDQEINEHSPTRLYTNVIKTYVGYASNQS